MNKMNQTQTRSPRKRLLSLILAVILMIGLLPISAFATSASAQAGEDKAATQDSEFLRIFHLDCGRKYFTVSEIEGIIDQLAENHYTHIQLAFGNNGFRFLLNDMSVKANNKTYSSDDVKNAVTNGNTTYSNGKNTASTMLSETDMDTIIAYAKGKDISIIPMLNTPGHMDALVSAMMELNVGTQRSDSEMSLTSDAQVEFIKALQQKYITYFASKGSKYYNLAADEYSFSGLSNTEYTVFAKYVNEVAKMVKDAKMTPLAYNDGFLYSGKATSVPFDKDIVICYWAQDTNYASVTELHNAGFKILNNNDAWYYVLGDYLNFWAHPQWRYADAKEGIQKVPVTQAKNVADKEIPVVGSVLCCWCDGPHLSWADSKDKVYDLIATMAKCNPDYFTGKVKLSASDDATGVSVAVTGAKGQKATVEVKKITSGFTFDTEAHVSYNVTPTVDGKAYTGEGTVTLPVPEGWATEASRIHAYIIDNGAVKLISGTLSGGKYTFQVPHFSEMGLVQLAKGAGSTENVTVAVGRTSKAYDLTGDNLPNDGTYPLGDVASYTVTTAADSWKVEGKANPITSGGKYVIGNGSQYLTLNDDGTLGTIDDSSNATVWTITKSSDGYTINSGSYYLSRSSSSGWSSYSLSASTISATWSWSANDGFYFTDYYGRYYYLTYSNGWTVSRYASTKGQPYTATEVPGGKTVTFKGLNPGSTSVTLGDTTYSVTVTEKQNVEIPISIIDYRADGLLFDWNYLQGDYSDSYRYGLVHGKSGGYGYVVATKDSTTGLYTVDGNDSAVEQIAGTKIEQTGPVNSTYGTTFYTGNLDNSWSRAGLVQEKLGANGMPVYTDAAVKYVASLLKAGYYNKMSGNCNSLIYNTFVASNGSRTIRNTSASGFSENFKNAKTYANISNAYDLAWYLLNTIYQADTNMATVTGTDGQTHSVPIYGMAVDAYKSIVLTDNGTGTYSFEAGYSNNPKYVDYDRTNGTISQGTGGTATVGFYPLDKLGYEQSGLLTKTSAIDSTHNGSFTLRGESQFVYNKDSNLYFTFTGDDDVYMYINGVLALDLGGAHGRNTKTVNLNEVADKCGLVDGQVATFTFFYMERCSDASTFGIKTNMELVQRAINVEKKAYDTSYANEYASGTAVINGTTVAYDLIVTNKSNSPMTQIKLTDTDSLHSENGSEYGKAELGYGVTTPSVTASTWIDPERRGTVALGQGNGYVLFITDSTGTEVANTRKSLSSLQALSDEIAGLTLPAGQSLHVRFLTAKTEINESKILDYINTVEVSATVGGQALSDKASHELYSYNAKDTGRTYVVDFGLPLEITGIFDEGARDNIGEVSLSPKNEQKYGTVTIAPSGFGTTLTYTRTADKTINEPETITLDVVYNIGNSKIKLEKTLTIIPASNVYYEDSLATFTDGSGAASGADWKLVDSNGNENVTEDTTTTQALQQLGDKAIYGNDDAYNSSSKLSMGTAHKVTVTSEMLAKWEKNDTTSAWPTASFTFTGTGFDVISLTDNTSGAILVKVTGAGADNSNYSKNYLVNNYYGYKQVKNEDGRISWVVSDSKEPNALYQIPVMKVDVPYGAYNVTIQVFYNQIFDKTGGKQYNFWLDAIRVYNPMGENGNSYYTQDNEGYPQYIKLHDALADGTAKPDDKTDKMVFIDGGSTADIATYANYGPNNEVYLMKGQAITFKIPQNANVDSIQIGAKAPDGKTAKMVVNSSEPIELNTATEMYYTISSGADQFTISNTGDGILSLTNLKITYKTKPAENEKVTLAALDTQEQENAVNLVRALFTAPVATFSPETFQADWGRAVRAGKRATLTVKTSADVESITVDGQSITSYTTRTQRTGWGWWSPKVTYHVFTYTITAPAQTTDYAVCAVNAEGTASEPITATLTVRPATWWNWWF